MSSKASIRNTFLFKSALLTSIGLIAFKLYQKQSNIKNIIEEKKNNIRAHWSYEVLDNEKEANRDLNVLIHSTDHFRGVRINADTLPLIKNKFASKLKHSLQKWSKEERRGVFLKIPIKLAGEYLAIALSNGFSVHHARPGYIMLTQWLPKHEINMIPDYCHTYMATGCFIINEHKQAVVIKEIWNHGRNDHWKLPGGAIDRLENIFDAAIRETKEETGLDTQFKGILQFRHFHPFRFMNSGDIYFISLLKYDGILDDGKEFHIDKKEIDEIKWMDIDLVLELKSQQPTFGSKECKENIKRNVDTLVQNWDNNEQDIDLQTFRPIEYKFTNQKKDRKWYVYAPTKKLMTAKALKTVLK